MKTHLDENTSYPTTEDQETPLPIADEQVHQELLGSRDAAKRKKVCGIRMRFEELGVIHLLTIVVIFGLPYVGLCYDFYE